MQRITVNIKRLTVTIDGFFPNLQQVRWARKPLWLPTAKSKLFRVAKRPVIPSEDAEELKRLHNNYRSAMKSLTKYFTEKYSAKNIQQLDMEQHKKDITEDFISCNKINNEWNAKIKPLREQRIQKETEESIEVARNRLKKRLEIRAANLEVTEEMVRKVKEASKQFISEEKLDAAIEYAINNPVDYNFALNLDGSKIYGRGTGRSAFEVKEKATVKQ